MTETRLKIAVFIDFDNIEIGVKTTLGQQFDIAAILEGIKERGEVVTKVAYGDWKRAGDHGRLLSQHAIRMVQRNLTPGGDKNGADINLALDALEMAFTHDHINAFVIVGGDSDFITLVEKLKQYDKKVFVVGGRQFTSLVMQKNCHEFIAYENLVSARRPSPSERRPGGTPSASSDVNKAIPLVRRALKVLVDREVSPQLGLLKSTLLQLDSTFSERDYGVSTFRDFIEKVAETGLVTLRHAGRSLLVDLAEDGGGQAGLQQEAQASQPAPAQAVQPADVPPAAAEPIQGDSREAPPTDGGAQREGSGSTHAPAPAPVDEGQARQAIQQAQEVFQRAGQTPRFPMYVRQVKQYLRAADESFDERKVGFATIVEFLRACQREGVFRLERDRQGVLRVFPGPNLQRPAAPADLGQPEPVQPSLTEAPEGAGPQEPAGDAGRNDGPMADAMAEAAEPVLGIETAPVRMPTPPTRHARAADDEDEPNYNVAQPYELPRRQPGRTARVRKTPETPRPATPRTAPGRAPARTVATRKTAAPRTPAVRAPRGRKKPPGTS